MPTRAQEADEDEGDENIDQDLRKNRLAISLALGRRKKRKWVRFYMSRYRDFYEIPLHNL